MTGLKNVGIHKLIEIKMDLETLGSMYYNYNICIFKKTNLIKFF